MQQLDLSAELKRLAPFLLGLNLLVYLAVSAVIGFTISFALGLLLGTLLVAADLLLLYRTISGAVVKSVSVARARIIASYLLRLLLIGMVYYISLKCPLLNSYGVLIPLLYPRLIFVWRARYIKSKQL